MPVGFEMLSELCKFLHRVSRANSCKWINEAVVHWILLIQMFNDSTQENSDMVGPVLATDALSFTEIAANNNEIESVTDTVDVFTFEFDPIVLCSFIWFVSTFSSLNHYTFFILIDALIELLKYLINIVAKLMLHNFDDPRHLPYDLIKDYLSISESSTHQINLLLFLPSMCLDIQDVKDLVAYLKVIIGGFLLFFVLMISFVSESVFFVSHRDMLVEAERSHLLGDWVPHDHLTVQDAGLGIDAFFDSRSDLWTVNPCVVIGIPCEELDHSIL